MYLTLILLFLALATLAAGLHDSDVVSGETNAYGILSSSELINNSFLYDNKIVGYRGEVVGPVMVRGEYSWVNLYDGTYAIGVWCLIRDTSRIRFYGDYNNRGDLVEVSGVFHRACASHGGDLDIHCSSLEIVEEGYPVKHVIRDREFFTAFVLGLIALVLFLFEFTIKKRKKESA